MHHECYTGPLFFDTYCNEFKVLLGDDSYVLHADDTSLVYVGDDLQKLTANVNTKLSLISDWCKFNKLSLNPDKSEVIFMSSRKYDIHPFIHIEGNAVKQVNICKYLGVYKFKHLKFQPPIDHMERKLTQYCGISYRLMNDFNYDTARKLYYSCVYSTFTSCRSVWRDVSQCTSRCERIIKLQQRIVKNVFAKYFLKYNVMFK